jgi:hypothetical protein
MPAGRRGRILGVGGVALVSPVLFVSGCSLLLDVQVLPEGPCASSLDCPVLETCIDHVCRPDVPADARVGESVPDAPTAPTLDAESGASFDAGLAPDVPDGPAAETACSPTDEAGGDGGCGVCDTLTHACIGGVCRVLVWTSPVSNLGEPQAALPDNRQYGAALRDMLHAEAIRIVSPGQLLRIGFLLSTGQQNHSYQIGLYDDDGGYPGHLVFGSPLEESDVYVLGYTLNSGREEVVVPACPRVHLAAGTYWITFVSQEDAFAFQSTSTPSLTVDVPAPDAGSPWLDPFPPNAPVPTPMSEASNIVYVMVAEDSP